MSRHRVRCRTASGDDDESSTPREEHRCRTTSLTGAGSRSRSSSTGSSVSRSCSEPVQRQKGQVPFHASNDVISPVPPTHSEDDPSSLRLMEAARALLDQHHSFTETQLCQYVAEAYPEVPAEVRRGLVVGAVIGAQRAAHLRYIIMDNKESPDADKRSMAAHAASSLSFWSLGFRQRPRLISSTPDTVRISRATCTSPTFDEERRVVCKSVNTQTSPNHIRTLEDLSDLMLPVMPRMTDDEFDFINRATEMACLSVASLFPAHTADSSSILATDERTLVNDSPSVPLLNTMNVSNLETTDDAISGETRPAARAEMTAPDAPVVSGAATVSGSGNETTVDSASRQDATQTGDRTPPTDAAIVLYAPSDVEDTSTPRPVRPDDQPEKVTGNKSGKPTAASRMSAADAVTGKSMPSTQKGSDDTHSAAVKVSPEKKRPSRTSPVENRQPAASMGFRSPLVTLESSAGRLRYQSNRRSSPRLHSRSPRREDRRRCDSPERLILTGRELQEYRRLMNSKRRN